MSSSLHQHLAAILSFGGNGELFDLLISSSNSLVPISRADLILGSSLASIFLASDLLSYLGVLAVVVALGYYYHKVPHVVLTTRLFAVSSAFL